MANEVRNALVAQTVTQVTLEPGQPIDLVVQVDPEVATSVEELRQLPVGTVAKVPLEQVATVEQADVQGSITRIDQAPAARVTAEILSEDTGAVSAWIFLSIDALKADGSIPVGVTVELAGVSQQQTEAFGGLFASMGVAVLLVYLMLVLTFNSLITPFIILFSLPLATIGAFAALYPGRPADRGVGADRLPDAHRHRGHECHRLTRPRRTVTGGGMATHEALIEGGRTRVRPILMTAIATILALIPLAAGFNQGSIIAAELGTVVIGGLFSSTFLTLLVVPAVYLLVDGVKSSSGGAARRMHRPSQ